LKRNKVEAHLRFCGYAGVTCVDCNATFRGEAYFAHSTCISEAEKYQGALFKANGKPPNANDAWVLFIENLDAAASNEAPQKVKALVPRLAALSNVPRNEKKFKNFVS
jgi:cell growth-regulating nucleolar protein